jgi:hypothetical protein
MAPTVQETTPTPRATIELTLNASFSEVVPSKDTLAYVTFKQKLAIELATLLGVPLESIVIESILEGSIKITFTVDPTKLDANQTLASVSAAAETLQDKNITVGATTMPVASVKVSLPLTITSTTPVPTPSKSSTQKYEGLHTVDIVIIAIAATICCILIIVGVVLCCKACRRKRAKSFDFESGNLFPENFTLERIPRAKSTYHDDGVTQDYDDKYTYIDDSSPTGYYNAGAENGSVKKTTASEDETLLNSGKSQSGFDNPAFMSPASAPGKSKNDSTNATYDNVYQPYIPTADY